MNKNKKTINKRISILVWITIISSLMSFFGFIYEEIDFIPNFMGATPIEAKIQWSNFHSLTNPAYYHIPSSIITIFCIIMVWLYRQHLSNHQVKKLKTATIAIIFVNILTGIAVAQLNNKLYFGTTVNNSEVIKNLATIWAILNFIRISLVAFYTIILVKMFSIKLITN